MSTLLGWYRWYKSTLLGWYKRKCPASEIVAKYHISSAVVLYGWLDKYLNEKVCVSLQQETDNDTDM
ncbi:MAG: hypothetical protein IK126_06645, partial [Bacteroidales bacterium]|nr:hypothetical protein [Bacteroidales bacterium]